MACIVLFHCHIIFVTNTECQGLACVIVCLTLSDICWSVILSEL